MKRYVCILITILLITNCVAQYTPPVPEKGFTYIEPVNTDYATYDKAFGSAKSGTQPEFQLVKPTSIAVNDSGDVLVFDDGRIKIYRQDGSEKRIVGAPGIHPGEFSRTDRIFISPDGSITVLSEPYRSHLNEYYFCSVFDPDYRFINKLRFTETPLFRQFIKSQNISMSIWFPEKQFTKIYHLSNTERILDLYKKLNDAGNTKYSVFIYKEDFGKNDLIVQTDFSVCLNSYNYSELVWISQFCWDMLPNRNIIYVNTDEDSHKITGLTIGSAYTVHIRSIDTNSDVKITHPFTAIAFPDSMGTQYFNNNERKSRPKRFKEVLEFFKNRKFYASVSNILVDGDYVFIYLFKKEDLTDKSDKEKLKAKNTPYTVDVLDTKTGKFLSSVQLPVKFKAIKNGYAYDIELNIMGYYEIRKYCLNPAVYGK